MQRQQIRFIFLFDCKSSLVFLLPPRASRRLEYYLNACRIWIRFSPCRLPKAFSEWTSPLAHVGSLQKHKAGGTCQTDIMVLFSGNDSTFVKTHLCPRITFSKSIVGLTHFCVNASQRRKKAGHWEDWWIALRQTDHYERAVDHKQMT